MAARSITIGSTEENEYTLNVILRPLGLAHATHCGFQLNNFAQPDAGAAIQQTDRHFFTHRIYMLAEHVMIEVNHLKCGIVLQERA
jgi:hypothetical protein